MNVNILAVGDVSGPVGMEILSQKLRVIKKQYDISFTVVNGENASGLGISKKLSHEIINAGADVVTLGNHTWSKLDICNHLDEVRYLVRPANLPTHAPGTGWGLFEASFGSVCVINLVGRVDVPMQSDNPFLEVDRLIKNAETKVILVDFHAEATSEKLAMAYHLDGRVTALWGTHTHVQTSDARVFDKGMGYITDLGMTGAIESVIGMNYEQPVKHFLGYPVERFIPAEGAGKLEGAIFEIDTETGKCLSVEAIRIT